MRSRVRSPVLAPESDFQTKRRLFDGTREARPTDFPPQNSGFLARLRALICFGGGGSSQRFLWQQPFSQKGCYPMQFFPYFPRPLSTFPSVRANVSAFVDYEIFPPPATFSFSSLMFKYSAQSCGIETFCRSDEICASKDSWRIQGSGHFCVFDFLVQ